MKRYLITYDNKRPRNYQQLYRLMAQWKAVPLAESVWLVNLTIDAGAVRDIVRRTMQRDDLVAVLELQAGSDWATCAVSPAAGAWLATYISPVKKVA